MSSAAKPAGPLAARQFSLAGLLSFVLACAVYFGVVSETTRFFRYFVRGPIDEWRPIFTIILGWGLLWAIYRAWRLRPCCVRHA